MKPVLICLTALGVAACGGGGGGGGGVDPRLDRLDQYAAQKLRVLGDPGMGVGAMPVTDIGVIPQTGSAVFTGSATLRVEVGNAPLVLSGDAAITLDFDQNTTHGTLDNFFGIGANQQVADYSGQITLTGGPAAPAFDISYGGSLTAAGQTLGLDGTLDGQLLGADMDAVVGSDLEATVMQGTTGRDATLIIITEFVPPSDPPQDP